MTDPLLEIKKGLQHNFFEENFFFHISTLSASISVYSHMVCVKTASRAFYCLEMQELSFQFMLFMARGCLSRPELAGAGNLLTFHKRRSKGYLV